MTAVLNWVSAESGEEYVPLSGTYEKLQWFVICSDYRLHRWHKEKPCLATPGTNPGLEL